MRPHLPRLLFLDTRWSLLPQRGAVYPQVLLDMFALGKALRPNHCFKAAWNLNVPRVSHLRFFVKCVHFPILQGAAYLLPRLPSQREPSPARPRHSRTKKMLSPSPRPPAPFSLLTAGSSSVATLSTLSTPILPSPRWQAPLPFLLPSVLG